jgi:hypothetical protein
MRNTWRVPVLIIAENAKVAGITIPDRFENTDFEIMISLIL